MSEDLRGKAFQADGKTNAKSLEMGKCPRTTGTGLTVKTAECCNEACPGSPKNGWCQLGALNCKLEETPLKVALQQADGLSNTTRPQRFGSPKDLPL